jgi:hypothetical protein
MLHVFPTGLREIPLECLLDYAQLNISSFGFRGAAQRLFGSQNPNK